MAPPRGRHVDGRVTIIHHEDTPDGSLYDNGDAAPDLGSASFDPRTQAYHREGPNEGMLRQLTDQIGTLQSRLDAMGKEKSPRTATPPPPTTLLGRTASVVRDGGHVANVRDPHATVGHCSQRALAARTRALHFDFQRADAVFGGLLAGIVGGLIGGIKDSYEC